MGPCPIRTGRQLESDRPERGESLGELHVDGRTPAALALPLLTARSADARRDGVFLAALMSGFTALLLSSVLLGHLITDVLLTVGWIHRADDGAIDSLVAGRTPFLTDASGVASAIGSVNVLAPLAALAAAPLAPGLQRRDRRLPDLGERHVRQLRHGLRAVRVRDSALGLPQDRPARRQRLHDRKRGRRPSQRLRSDVREPRWHPSRASRWIRPLNGLRRSRDPRPTA